MLKLKTLAATFALTALAFPGCDRDKDDDSNDDHDPAAWEFGNTADKATFAGRLGDLDKLSRSAERGSVPVTRGGSLTKKASAWEVLESYAAGDAQESGSDSVSGDGCAELTSLFGFGDDTAHDSGFALTDGGSCSQAVKDMRSFYAQSLGALKQQVAFLKTLKPGTEVCGMIVEELPVDAKTAAVGFRLVPKDLPADMQYDQRVFGGANDTEVGSMTSLSASFAGSRKEGAPGGFSVVGKTQAIGKLAEKKLRLGADFVFRMQLDDPKHGGKKDVTTSFSSKSEISGLGDTDLLKVSEQSTFELIGDLGAAPGAEPYKVALALNLTEVGEGRLRVSGSYTSNDSKLAPQTFQVEFVRTGGHCSVNTRVPETEDPDSDPGLPGVPFDNEKLKGTWKSECATASLGKFGYRRYQELASFDGTYATRSLIVYGDDACFPGKELATIWLAGTYKLGAELPDASRYDEVSEYALDLSYSETAVLLSDDARVEDFNREAVCGKSDWQKGVAATFGAGACYFDLGTEPLLNLYLMQTKQEFTAVRPFANLATLELAQTNFFRGDSAAARARTSTGTQRVLKRQ